ncbi:hypothetical protein HKD42_11740 [Altererythrobacter sp. RZ02]|uniref:Uncharacterized protein n=1 Tax=Pontixanthobacter rizhaonensis TaxID=2730337 RepID=A0A848QNI2_9SPHN|nr:hypothetical protein [Pontixanthobacter rizhaonensis]NMW32734.1 hypothetical protein [Pontixanthobacter rizhaonensis]
MDDPNTERLVQLRHKRCRYPSIEALEEDISEYRASLIARSSAEGSWSRGEREQILKDLDDYSDMLDEHMVWCSEIDLHSRHLEQQLRADLKNLPDPFGATDA